MENKIFIAVVVVVVSDGLYDCMDPDCCVDARCSRDEFCSTVPDPMEILLRKQPPSNTASFYARMRFLADDDSVQSFANIDSFHPTYVAQFIRNACKSRAKMKTLNDSRSITKSKAKLCM